jgi:transcriptional regulator with XRE-family HTH domain
VDEWRARAAFARTLRIARRRRTQDAVSRRAGVCMRTWIRWESGDQSPTVARLPQIAAALGVPLGDLLAHWLYELEATPRRDAA